MILDWSSIKSLFQIPKTWFERVHNFCFRSYGGNLITMRDRGDGSTEIYIDDDELAEKVKSISGSDNVKSVDDITPDDNGNVLLDAVKSVDGVDPDDDGNVLLNAVYSVDGIDPDDNGSIDFGLTASKWMKTDASGHIGTTTDVPLLNKLQTGNAILKTSSDGTIVATQMTANKLLKTDANGLPNTYNLTASKWVKSDANGLLTTTNDNPLVLGSSTGILYSNAGTLQYKSFGTTAGTVSEGNHQHGNYLTAIPDEYLLTSDINASSGTRTVASNYHSNIAYTGTTHGAIDNIYNWVGMYSYDSMDDQIDSLGYYKLPTLTANKMVVTDASGDLTTRTLTGSKLLKTNASGLPEAYSLTASKWVKSDANGLLTTTNDTPVAVDTSKYTPLSGEITVVTNVLWTGSALQYKAKKLSFVNGVLCSVGNETTTTIDTAVAY